MISQGCIGSRCLRVAQNMLPAGLFSLDSAEICFAARLRTRLHDFEDVDIENRITLLTNSLEAEANLHLQGRFLARMHLQGLLENRLRLVHAWKNLPELPGETIERPLFITGMPRSGSTFLHDLFVRNENNRAPLVWEVMSPPLSPQPDPRDVIRRIRHAARCLWFFRQIAPGASAAHPMTALSPQECVAVHSYAMLSQEFTITFNVPGYVTYLRGVDFTPAYIWQKRLLQFLQFRNGRKQWVLKAPDHVFSLEALFKVFPDAVIIQMHRDPVDVLRSSLNLIGGLRRVFAVPQGLEEIAVQESGQLADGVERIEQFRDSHPQLANRFFDVYYNELVSNPIQTVRRLHLDLGLPWDNARLAEIHALASSRSRYRQHGPHISVSSPFLAQTWENSRVVAHGSVSQPSATA